MGLCESQNDSNAFLMRQIGKRSGKIEDMRLKPALHPRFRSTLGPSELMHKRILYEEMLTIVRFFTGRLITQLADTPIVIVISDENGCELDMAGDETMQQLAAARHRSGSAIHRRSMRNEQHHSCEDI